MAEKPDTTNSSSRRTRLDILEDLDGTPCLDLLEMVDEVNRIRSLIECAWMAGASLLEDECDAIQEVLGDAGRRLAAVGDKLNAARGALVEDANV